MARALTKKQKGFVRDYVKTGNGSLAVKKNYAHTTDLTARVIASENLTKPNIIEAIKSIAERLPDQLLEKVHLEGLEATKLSGTGGMRMKFSGGDMEEFGHCDLEVPDHPTRAKFLDLAYKVKGIYAPERNVNVNIEADLAPELTALAEKLNSA